MHMQASSRASHRQRAGELIKLCAKLQQWLAARRLAHAQDVDNAAERAVVRLDFHAADAIGSEPRDLVA